MKQLIFFISLFISASVISSNKIDSLKAILNTDAENPLILAELSNEYINISYDISRKYANKVLLLDNTSFELKAKIYRIIGILKVQQNQNDSAIYFYKKSLDYFSESNNLLQKAMTISNIGGLYHNTQDLKNALINYNEALDIFINFKNTEYISVMYNNIGLVYFDMNEIDKSIEYYNKALENKKTELSKAPVYGNIANSFKEKNEEEKALEYYKKAQAIFEANKMQYDLTILMNDIGKLYFDNGNVKKANKYFLNALSISKKNNFLKLKELSLNNLISLNKFKGEYELVSKYYDELVQTINISVLEENKKLINEYKIKYETEKKEELLAAKERELYNKTKWLYTFIIGFIISLTLLILFFIQRNITNKANIILVKKNLELANSEKILVDTKEELETISEIKLDEAEVSTNNNSLVLLYNRLIELFEKEKTFCNSNETIETIAKQLNTNKTYLSQAVNQNFGSNFSNFINSYRIKEAILLFAKDKTSEYTIAAIANNVGFNSISAFNRAFKKETGLTPSFFLKSMNEK